MIKKFCLRNFFCKTSENHDFFLLSKFKGKKYKRERIREWRNENNYLFDILKSGINVSKFDEYERQFYERQKGLSREGFLSEDIDEDFKDRVAKRKEIVKENQIVIGNVEEEYLLDEMNELDLVESEMNDSTISTRSGLRLVNIEEVACQTDPIKFEQPVIKYQRKCTEQMKTLCAKVSLTAHISAKRLVLLCKLFAVIFMGISFS